MATHHRFLAHRSFWPFFLHTAGWCCLFIAAALGSVWGGMALFLHAPPTGKFSHAAVWLWGVAWLLLVGCALLQKRMVPILAGGLPLMLGLWIWWASITPQADRAWADDVAQLVNLTPDPQQPGIVQLNNVRNFQWRSDTDYTPRWETRSYDLNQLRSVDVVLSYWMGPAIAHTLVSFGFTDGQHVVFSIEIRKEKHEQFDALAGFFKQYEMALVAADERDILAVRTNVRSEQVHLYRISMAPSSMRDLFMAYAQQAEQLRQTPRFYHTLTANCTTIVWQLARRIGQALPTDWRLLASGYLPEYLRDAGALQSPQPIEVLRAAGNMTERAQNWQRPAMLDDAGASADFSRHIRQGWAP